MRVYSDQEARTLKARRAKAVYEHLQKKKTDQVVAYPEDGLMCISCDSQVVVYPEDSQVPTNCTNANCGSRLAQFSEETAESCAPAMGQDTLLKRRIRAIGHIVATTEGNKTKFKVCGHG